MRILLSGASGYVGQFILREMLDADNDVIMLGRHKPVGDYFDRAEFVEFDLDNPPNTVPKADALVHCAFDHLPGRYRGGEGDKPGTFIRRNFDGSLALFKAAKKAKVKRIIFLSSRAVYDGYDMPTILSEDIIAKPANLYGHVKWLLEQHLLSLSGVITTSLRPTGIYGRPWPGAWHKWQTLFEDFEAGKRIEPRSGTEVHGADVAAAVLLCLRADPEFVDNAEFNLSDIRVDRRDLLAAYAKKNDLRIALPPFDFSKLSNEIACSGLRKLGWTPRGVEGLMDF